MPFLITDMDNKFLNKQLNLPMHNFTQEDLVQYLYDESSPEKATAIKTALETDWNLREKYQEMLSSKKRLGLLEISPRKKAVDKILIYAEKSVGEITQEV